MRSAFGLTSTDAWESSGVGCAAGGEERGEGIAALSKECADAVERMRQIYDKRRKLMVELMRDAAFARFQKNICSPLGNYTAFAVMQDHNCSRHGGGLSKSLRRLGYFG